MLVSIANNQGQKALLVNPLYKTLQKETTIGNWPLTLCSTDNCLTQYDHLRGASIESYSESRTYTPAPRLLQSTPISYPTILHPCTNLQTSNLGPQAYTSFINQLHPFPPTQYTYIQPSRNEYARGIETASLRRPSSLHETTPIPGPAPPASPESVHFPTNRLPYLATNQPPHDLLPDRCNRHFALFQPPTRTTSNPKSK